MSLTFLRICALSTLILYASSVFGVDGQDSAAYKNNPKSRQVIAQYWELFNYTKSLEYNSESYRESFQALLEIETTLTKRGITESEMNQLRFEAQNVELVDLQNEKAKELIQILSQLGERIHMLNETEVATTLAPYLATNASFSQKLSVLDSRLFFDKTIHPERALLMYRFGIGVVILRQLVELGADNETLDKVQTSFLVNFEQLSLVTAQSARSQSLIVSTELSTTLQLVGGGGDPELTGKLVAKWREQHPKKSNFSASLMRRSVAETLSFFKKEPIFLIITFCIGLGTKDALITGMSHDIGAAAPVLLAPFLVLDSMLALVLGYATWIKYQVKLMQSENGRSNQFRSYGIKMLSDCKRLLNEVSATPKILEPPSDLDRQ